ncbi:AraC-type DNA-binding protein [Lactonifactor longoviformis DSM 17459]|uniref:AraC-type DNA-binding protein n=1 Tax=Lactonifactor longoviformis DSM 17459 TaxID=1122155 RepID=A0A1M5CVM3_9CLOT|nr:AraC-type DNA-binding protein [Lactonifactor longoviformis DSM 17459]
MKSAYYLLFFILIVIPILGVLVVSLILLNRQFEQQAVEMVQRAQETIAAELMSDIDVMSMRLSNLVYANDNEILKYAAGTDLLDSSDRYQNIQNLNKAQNLSLEPVKDIISISFQMKSNHNFYLKNEIKRSSDQIKEEEWYQNALKSKNNIVIGTYDTRDMNDLFLGGNRDMLILIFALSPDIKTDRSQKIEMIILYQSSNVADRIKANNKKYRQGKNKLGITQIRDSGGNLIYSTEDSKDYSGLPGYTCIKTPVTFRDTVWYIENYVRPGELSGDFRKTALLVLGVAVMVLLFASYFSRYFLRGIVKPVEAVNQGLKQVEEGNLDVYIAPGGQYEVRNMMYQFNAMVKRLRALIQEYEEKVKSRGKTAQEYFCLMMKGCMTPEEADKETKEFFMDQYAVFGLYISNQKSVSMEGHITASLVNSFERNPRYASRCLTYTDTPNFLQVFYRITEEDYRSNMVRMIEEIQRIGSRDYEVHIFACISRKGTGPRSFAECVREVKEKICLRHLVGEEALIELEEYGEEVEDIIRLSGEYSRLAEALYIADEKNVTAEKEKLFALFSRTAEDEIRKHMYALILAIGDRFTRDGNNFFNLFGQEYNYVEKINRIEEMRSIKLWITNYLAWIVDYSASKLNISETDMVIKAKRYMADNYEDPGLSLSSVAKYVNLSEKYFTNRFTKEAGETFSEYLTGLRMQKARELLRTTSFKVYEVAEMVGYNNVEHFNRMFKKLHGMSPTQYRKES